MKRSICFLGIFLFMFVAPAFGADQEEIRETIALDSQTKKPKREFKADLLAVRKRLQIERRKQLFMEKIELLSAIKKLPGGDDLADRVAKTWNQEQDLNNDVGYQMGMCSGYEQGIKVGVGIGAGVAGQRDLELAGYSWGDHGCTTTRSSSGRLRVELPTEFEFRRQPSEGNSHLCPATNPDLPEQPERREVIAWPSTSPVFDGSSSMYQDPATPHSFNDLYALHREMESQNLQLQIDWQQKLLIDQVRQLNNQIYMESLPSTKAPPPIANAPRFEPWKP